MEIMCTTATTKREKPYTYLHRLFVEPQLDSMIEFSSDRHRAQMNLDGLVALEIW